MKTISAARQRDNVLRRQVMIEVRERDSHSCVGIGRLPEPCHGPLNGHEIITQGQGGSRTDPRNIVLLCNFHNEWCDLNHDEAIALGFRQLRYDPYSSNVATCLPQEIVPRRPQLTLLRDAPADDGAGAGEVLMAHLTKEWGLTWPDNHSAKSQKPGASLEEGAQLPNERNSTHGTH